MFGWKKRKSKAHKAKQLITTLACFSESFWKTKKTGNHRSQTCCFFQQQLFVLMQQTPNHFVTGTYSPAHQGTLYLPGKRKISQALKSSWWSMVKIDFPCTLIFPPKQRWRVWKGIGLLGEGLCWCTSDPWGLHPTWQAQGSTNQHPSKFWNGSGWSLITKRFLSIQVEPNPDWWFIGGRMRPGGTLSFNHSHGFRNGN